MIDGESAGAAALIAAPMHGEVKMRSEGLRTRDGHVLEWFSKLRPGRRVSVHSRPEPWPRLLLARQGGVRLPPQLELISPQPLAVPSIRNRRDWWVKSEKFRRPWPAGLPAIAWNPIEAATAIRLGENTRTLVFDLLDDWLEHELFENIHAQLEDAYRTIFEQADVITANSEGTVDLAKRFGREAELIPNGVDPERFDLPRQPQRKLVVGYGGKIGFRLDLDLIRRAAEALPDVDFEFAGPVMESNVASQLRGIGNLRLLGDQRYDVYPENLARWDVGWVPHQVGRGEIGGDVIKTYEYRAAGLPTFATRIIGWERFLPGVRSPEPDDFVPELVEFVGNLQPGSSNREPIEIPESDTWRFKATRLLSLLDGDNAGS